MSLQSLPIKNKLQDIINFIKLRKKSVIIAPTGYGKSVEIPSALSDFGKVWVSLPTGLAINSLKSSQNIFNPLLKIGVLSETEESILQANVVYGTSSSIRRKITEGITAGKYYDITFCDYLIIDEAHIGNSDNYLIIGLLDLFEKAGKKIPTVVIMGATITDDQFLNIKKEDRYKITLDDANTFKITEIYHDTLYHPKDKRVYQKMAELILSNNDKYSINKGDSPFMVFVPGKKEMEILERILSPQADKGGLLLLLITGSSTADTFRLLFSKKKIPNKRKIIITTNVLETSVTIENVFMVFDSMLEKTIDLQRPGWLITQYISKSSSIQRKGRTGRTSDGYVYKMITKQKYEELPNHKEEEIYIMDLTNIIVGLVTIGVNPIEVLPKKTHVKIPKYLKIIKSMGLIDLENNLTLMGKFFTQFDISVESYAILWWLLQITNELFYGIVVVSIINSINQPFLNLELGDSKEDFILRLNKHKITYYSKFSGRSELHTILNMFNNYFSKTAGHINNKVLLREWTSENKLEYKTFRTIVDTLTAIISILSKNSFIVNIPDEILSSTRVLDYMRPILRRVYKSNELILTKEKGIHKYISQSSGEDKEVYKFSIIHELNEYNKNYPARILVIKDKVSSDKSGKKYHNIEISLNIEEYQLMDRVISKTELLSGYVVKMPKKYIISKKEAHTSSLEIQVPIDYTKIIESHSVVPKMAEQLYIPVLKPKLVTPMTRPKK